MSIFQEISSGKKMVSVIGLGYVGLPLALELAKKFKVIGFDINDSRVEMMRNNIDPSNELKPVDFLNRDIQFTSNPTDLSKAHFHIVAVPTPIDQSKVPNLRPLLGASETVGKILKKGDYVVFESTVYPGCTEEDCVPILEKHSGLKCGPDFKVGYSPERINPGDKNNTLTKIKKVVSGMDTDSANEIEKLYGSIITAGVFKAESIKVAEAAKIIENTQRDLNIALMNELAIIFDRMNIDTHAVLEAAGTKWNFLNFYPGLVGGHCIGVDPYYLTFKAQKLGYSPQVILSGRAINDNMPAFVAKKVTQSLIKKDKNPSTTNVLVLGITFKENVSDIRNTKVVPLVKEMQNYSINVDIFDPLASKKEVFEEYQLNLIEAVSQKYDAIVFAVKHTCFDELYNSMVENHLGDDGFIIDIKGVYNKSKIKNNSITYWRL